MTSGVCWGHNGEFAKGPDSHCCWVNGEACPHKLSNYIGPDGVYRLHACGLVAKYGNWEDAMASPEYAVTPGPYFSKMGIICSDWPDFSKGQWCSCKGPRPEKVK